MRQIQFLLLFGLITLQLLARQGSDAQFAQYMQKKLDSAVKKNNIFGVACSVRMPNGQSWTGFSGTYDTSGMSYFQPDELYQTASITKMFVATLILQLAGEGKLSLDAPIKQFLPSYQWVDSLITVRQLLKHRTGIADYLTTNQEATRVFFLYPDSVWTPDHILSKYLIKPPLFTRESSFSYSNTNYLILGMIIEQVTGNQFHQELRRRILQPLGLRKTFMPPYEKPAAKMIRNWTDWNRDGVPDDASVMHGRGFASTIYTAGAMVSHPEDLVKFCYLLHSGKLLGGLTPMLYDFSDVSVGPSNNGYGLGVMRYDLHDKTYYGHSGDINGFTNIVIYSPADDLTLAIMINKDLQDRISLCKDLLSGLNTWLTASEVKN
ncbi:MAG TPA: serine hydrolase domain-containing protein [Niabella sp.]|nr:serine hydrolase domain-containing protein [Niabella sp.]